MHEMCGRNGVYEMVRTKRNARIGMQWEQFNMPFRQWLLINNAIFFFIFASSKLWFPFQMFVPFLSFSDIAAYSVKIFSFFFWGTLFLRKLYLKNFNNEHLLIVKARHAMSYYWHALLLYYVFHGRVTLFFANNSLTECRITMKLLHNFF